MALLKIKMRSKIKLYVLLVCIFLIIITLSSALNTKVNVKAEKERKVTIRFLDIYGTGTLPGGTFLEIPTDETGMASATFSSDLYNKIDVSTMKRSLEGNLLTFPDGQPTKLFKDLKTGWVYSIDLTSSNPKAVQVGKYADLYGSTTSNNSNNSSSTNINNSITNSSQSTSNEPASTEPSTEPAADTENTEDEEEDSESFFNWKKILIYSGIVFLLITFLAVLVYIFIKMKSRNVGSKIYFGKPISSSKLSAQEKRMLDDAQKKIIIAQNEINRIKDKDTKIRELEERIRKDRVELEKLRKHKI